jgi:hypothetical protein
MSDTQAKGVPQTRAEQAAYVVEKLRAFGVRVNPASRLGQMSQLLRRGDGRIEWDDCRRFPVALESIRDMYQVRLIVDTMENYRDDPTFRASVQKMMKDAALPQCSGDETPGRDTQFELFLVAICLRAGLLPVDYSEPDIVCVADGQKFAIAAKRLKSLDRFEARVKEAADQIGRSKLPGVIAIDWTIARNPGNEPITSGLRSQLSPVVNHLRTREFYAERGQDILRRLKGSGALAILTFEYVYRVNADSTGWIHDGSMEWFGLTDGDEVYGQALATFMEGFKRGAPNLIDLSAVEP